MGYWFAMFCVRAGRRRQLREKQKMQSKSRNPHRQVPVETSFENRLISYFEEYFQWLDKERPDGREARQFTVIARSPQSPVILTLQSLMQELRSRQIRLQVVFCDIEPERALRSAWNAISDLSEQGREHGDLIRWNSSQAVLEAHEQMVLGARMCWTGDAMRREPGKRDAFDLFETNAPQICRLGVQSFSAMWRLAQPVPKWLLRESRDTRPSATFAGPDQRALAMLSFFRHFEKSGNHCH